VLQPLPGMKPTRGQSREPQQHLQRHKRTGAPDRAQDPDFGASVGQTVTRQRESRGSKESEGEPKECPELLHAAPERETSHWSSAAFRFVTSRLTTTFGALPSHPRAVARGTPRFVAIVTSRVRWTSSRSR